MHHCHHSKKHAGFFLLMDHHQCLRESHVGHPTCLLLSSSEFKWHSVELRAPGAETFLYIDPGFFFLSTLVLQPPFATTFDLACQVLNWSQFETDLSGFKKNISKKDWMLWHKICHHEWSKWIFSPCKHRRDAMSWQLDKVLESTC